MSAQSTTPEASPTAELQDFYNLGFCKFGLEQAMEIEKASLATLVSLSAYAIDLSKSAALFAPITFSPLAGDVLDTATKAYASFLDLQMYWLTLLMPQADKPTASGSHKQPQAKAAPSAESGMDVVLGTPAGSKS